jgi:hypothetical protein
MTHQDATSIWAELLIHTPDLFSKTQSPIREGARHFVVYNNFAILIATSLLMNCFRGENLQMHSQVIGIFHDKYQGS